MSLERLGRQILRQQRYASPRTVSPFELDAAPEDHGLNVVDVAEPVTPKPVPVAAGPSVLSAAASGSAPGAAQSSDPRRIGTMESDPKPIEQTSAARVPPKRKDKPAVRVEQRVEKKSVERRTERVVVNEREVAGPTQVVEAPSVERPRDNEVGALTKAFAALDKRLLAAQANPDQSNANPQVESSPAAPPMLDPEVVAPVQQANTEHHVEVVIDNIVVNAVPPNSEPRPRRSRRDPAEGLARFQSRRR